MRDTSSSARKWTAAALRIQVGGDDALQQRWQQAVRRSARIIEPLWPEGYSDGPFSHAAAVLAMICIMLLPEQEPDDVEVSDLLDELRGGPGNLWLGERLSAAFAARGLAGGELGRRLAWLREKPEFFDYPDYLPAEYVPDFREQLAGIVEWTIAAIERSLAADLSRR